MVFNISSSVKEYCQTQTVTGRVSEPQRCLLKKNLTAGFVWKRPAANVFSDSALISDISIIETYMLYVCMLLLHAFNLTQSCKKTTTTTKKKSLFESCLKKKKNAVYHLD